MREPTREEIAELNLQQLYNHVALEHDIPLSLAKGMFTLMMVLARSIQEADRDGKPYKANALAIAFELSFIEIGTGCLGIPRDRMRRAVFEVAAASATFQQRAMTLFKKIRQEHQTWTPAEAQGDAASEASERMAAAQTSDKNSEHFSDPKEMAWAKLTIRQEYRDMPESVRLLQRATFDYAWEAALRTS